MTQNSSLTKLITSLITIIILTFNSEKAFPQLFDSEQNPPGIKFRQINTKNFQIIYPAQLETEAQRMANTLENIIAKVSSSLNQKPHRISVILQNQGTVSNGFVQLAPRRSEFFTTPSQSFDYQNWLNSLAVHEMRHVVQFDKLSGNLKRPLFESLALSMFGIILPPWYFEGDAVVTETALTNAGRGRIPEWNIILRSNLLSGKNFSYSKDYFGSAKDFTPGYYQLGFFMNSYLRRTSGKYINDSIFSRISRLPIRPYNLSNSIKTFTGLSTRQLHDSTLEELKRIWNKQLIEVAPKQYNILNKRTNKTPENFSLPQPKSNGDMIFLKSGKAHTPAIYVLRKSGETEKLFNIGPQENPWFDYSTGKVVWEEFRFDPRFQKRSFNVINIHDLKSGKSRQLTHRTRLFSPVLSSNAAVIAAVDISYSNQYSLLEISAETGRAIRRYPSPENYMLQMPSYNSTDDKIVVVGIGTTGKTLLELDRKSGKFRQLIPLQFQEILRPVYAGDQIVFKAHYNGIDNLYRLDPATGQIYQLTSVRYGAFNPSFDPESERIIFNSYSPEGLDIAEVKWEKNIGEKINGPGKSSFPFVEPLSRQEGDADVFDSIPSNKFASTRYRELTHLFYFHSAHPYSEEFRDNYKYGITLQSNNKLNTLGFYAGYQYNSPLQKNEFVAGFSYKKFLPIISVDYTNQADLTYRSGETVPVTWREHLYEAEISVPLTFNRFNNVSSVTLKTGTSYTSRYNIDRPFANLYKQIEFPMHYQLSLSHNSRRSARDLGPRWGQNLLVSYHHLPFDENINGELLTIKTSFFVPGLFRNHSTRISFNWQENSGAYRHSLDIPRVLGYSYLKDPGTPYNTLFLDYKFPLFYPDWELGPLAYIKRVKAGVFADFQNVRLNKPLTPATFGAELRADMNLLRFYLPNFDLGERVIFLNEKPMQFPKFEFFATYNF